MTSNKQLIKEFAFELIIGCRTVIPLSLSELSLFPEQFFFILIQENPTLRDKHLAMFDP